jgi:DhnA family fructose-bisphosphate aldolase class Ia
MSDLKSNLNRFFSRNNRTMIVPIDHGANIPVPGLAQPGDILAALEGVADAWVVNRGIARDFSEEMGEAALCLRADVYNPAMAAGSTTLFGVEDAVQLGASSVMHMLYPGHANEEAILKSCAWCVSECEQAGIPVIVETLPKGLGLPHEYTVEQIGFAVRQAAEIGAHVVKTAYPTDGDIESFAEVIASSWVPVVVLGGASMGDDRALLEMVHNSLQAGAAGIAIGRNVWAHPNPVKIAKALRALIHDDADVEAGLRIVQG